VIAVIVRKSVVYKNKVIGPKHPASQIKARREVGAVEVVVADVDAVSEIRPGSRVRERKRQASVARVAVGAAIDRIAVEKTLRAGRRSLKKSKNP